MSVAFILGGGNSIAGLDLSLLSGQHVAAVNRSFETYPCSEIFFGDMSFYEEFGEKIMSLPTPKVTTKQQLKNLPGVTVWQKTANDKTLCRIPKYLIKSNSGVMALNYLLQKGYKLIVLLGIDLQEINGRKHHHDGYTHPSPPKTCDEMLREWTGIRAQVWQKFGADIIHGTPGSKLMEVDYLPLPEIVEAIKTKDYYGGWWLPKGERHFRMMLKKSRTVDSRKTYQYQKLLPALEYVKRFDGVAVDIGSNVGFWAWHLAKRFTAVECFEPIPIHNECLKLNTKGVTNINLNAVALSAIGGEILLASPLGDCGATHVDSHIIPESRWVQKIKAQCRTLDSYNLRNVQFLKVDCEGWELPILRGAEKTLIQNNPVVVVEQKPENEKFGLPHKGAVSYLESLGYETKQVLSGDYIMTRRD